METKWGVKGTDNYLASSGATTYNSSTYANDIIGIGKECYFLQKQSPEFIQENLNDLCASVQLTIIEILLKKLKKAMQETGIKEVCIAGGVSANKSLRLKLEKTMKKL